MRLEARKLLYMTEAGSRSISQNELGAPAVQLRLQVGLGQLQQGRARAIRRR